MVLLEHNTAIRKRVGVHCWGCVTHVIKTRPPPPVQEQVSIIDGGNCYGGNRVVYNEQTISLVSEVRV